MRRIKNTLFTGLALCILLLGSGCGGPEDADSTPVSQDNNAYSESIAPAGLSETEELPDWLAEDEFGLMEDDPLPGSDTTASSMSPGSTPANGDMDEPPLLPEYRAQREQEIEASLLGDSSHAVNIGAVLNRCRGGTLDEDRVIRQLERIQTKEVKPGTRWTFANGMSVVYESYEQYEAYLWQQHDQCQSVEGLFNTELRSRIEKLAEQGNPQARYLYAMWPPERNVFSSSSTLETLDYHNRALDYTWANINQGERLGILAMGQSYSGRGLFTGADRSLGQVFLMAAELCGLQNDLVHQQTEEIRRRLQAPARASLLNTLQQDAAGIAELFCK